MIMNDRDFTDTIITDIHPAAIILSAAADVRINQIPDILGDRNAQGRRPGEDGCFSG